MKKRALKAKRVSAYDKMKQQNLDLVADLNSYSQLIDKLRQENFQLDSKLRARQDLSMIKERQALCNSLGQMIEAVAQSIRVIVGKEFM